MIGFPTLQFWGRWTSIDLSYFWRENQNTRVWIQSHDVGWAVDSFVLFDPFEDDLRLTVFLSHSLGASSGRGAPPLSHELDGGFLKVVDPEVTMGFNIEMFIHDDWMIRGFFHFCKPRIWAPAWELEHLRFQELDETTQHHPTPNSAQDRVAEFKAQELLGVAMKGAVTSSPHLQRWWNQGLIYWGVPHVTVICWL